VATPAVFVFIQKGCAACHDYMPKLERARARHLDVTVGVYDLAANDARVQHFAEALGVRATPTTVVQTSNGTHHRHVGSLPVAQIDQLLRSAR
jgi:thioredoxin-like negative regulator of GroEL